MAVLNLDSAAMAQSGAADDRLAYDSATKCFVANGLAARSRKRAGDDASAARYEAKARQSFDTAVLLGRSIGLSGQRVSQDFDAALSKELPKMRGETGYFQSAMATCKALGLM